MRKSALNLNNNTSNNKRSVLGYRGREKLVHRYSKQYEMYKRMFLEFEELSSIIETDDLYKKDTYVAEKISTMTALNIFLNKYTEFFTLDVYFLSQKDRLIYKNISKFVKINDII
jgi:hypothetical protein